MFLRTVYFSELREGSREYNDPNSSRFNSYLRGRNAIATLFSEPPADGGTPRPAGDIIMFGGAGVRTQFGGAIQMFAPNGQVIVGLEGQVPPATAGVVTQGTGNIEMYSRGSVLLGLSRIMTTFGGDILVWSAEGDINAGRGSKTTIVYTPPKLVYDNYGSITISPNVPSTGAGIASLNPIRGLKSGSIDLIAPLGTIDAGEAGIRSDANVNVAALQIVNAANISARGSTTGVPTVQAPNIGALSEASNVAGAAAQQVAVPQPTNASEQPSIIIVELLGFGGGDGEPPANGGQDRRRTPDRQSYDLNSPFQVLAVGQVTSDQLAELAAEKRRLAGQR